MSSAPLSDIPRAGGEPDRVALLARCAEGDRAALRTLYEADGDRLLGVALRIVRDRPVAEDVLHDAFVQIWQAAARFDPGLGSARGWMVAVVRNRALHVLRGHRREVELDEGAHAALPDPGESALEVLTRMSEGDALKRCLDLLDPQKRACIVVAFLDGCTHVEVAERLSLPLGTVKAWIRRGMLSLRECLA